MNSLRTRHQTPLLAVDCVAFDALGNVVLIKRRDQEVEVWSLPGGFVEIGETARNACVREMQEETGVSISADDLILINVYSDPYRDHREHVVSVAFFVQIKSNVDIIAASDAKHAELCMDWHTREFTFDHKKIIQDAFRLVLSAETALEARTPLP